jgi:EAL domain-containing protein (putative c-di-GMP-specific phosphodiesterase class I)
MSPKGREDRARGVARIGRRAIVIALFAFVTALGAARAQPVAAPVEGAAVAAPSAGDDVAAQAAPGDNSSTQAALAPQRESERPLPNGRLLPGLLLGLLLSIGAYHIGRQVYDNAPGSRGASALLVAGFVYEYVAFGLHEPLVGTGRPSLILSGIAACGVAVAGLVFLSGFLTLKLKDGPACAITRILMAAAVLLAVIAPLKPHFTLHAADGMLAAALLWSLGAAVIYARQGDTRAAFLLPGLVVLAAALLGAGALLVIPSLSEVVFVPLLHGIFVIGLLVIAFAVTNAWNEPVPSYLALSAPVPALPDVNTSTRSSGAGLPRNQRGATAGAPKAGRFPVTKDRELGKALAASGHGLWDWDIPAGRISLSPETEIMLGMEKGFFDGSEESFLAAIAESDRDTLREKIAERVAQGEGAFSLTFAVRNNGASRRLCLEGSCFANWEGVVVRCVGLLREAPSEALAATEPNSVPTDIAAPSMPRLSPPPAAAMPEAPGEPAEPSVTVAEKAEPQALPNEPAAVASELTRALEREEFELYYRPIISLADKRVAGFEGTLHWRHPKLGLLKPGEFMAAAEDKGLGGALAKYAFTMACVQLYQWQTFFPLARALFATVSIRDPKLLGPELLANVKAILATASLAPGTLRLEIAEPMLLGNTQAGDILGQLKRCGAGIVLDGDTASATLLSTLERFPLDTVKISCACLALDSTADMKTLRSIIERARRLHMEVIASGIEREAQVKSLRGQACEFAQGQYFGAPLSVQDAQNLIAHFWSGPASGVASRAR